MEIKRLEGQRYGRLVILSRDGAVNYISRYTCRCDCGNVVHGMRLESIKKKQSCGCLTREKLERQMAETRLRHENKRLECEAKKESREMQVRALKYINMLRREYMLNMKLKEQRERSNLRQNNILLYYTWQAMIQRCSNPNHPKWMRYGGRGISVCDEWKKDFFSFLKWCKANGYKHGLTIDRINNDGNYEPSNCRWTTYLVQENNKSKVIRC